ncbi:hypothetical protein [Paenibacillus odorifer]|uniref:hypothetical protein n=1 Tax=Paenibacillus odorifer TaxID=189426 RepID=UPI00096DA16F|nr:hypothetical protein [Paenibacillus odorifer]OMD66895.1 hypothetical protein BSK50_30425 [Paenibacillus odorifer]
MKSIIIGRIVKKTYYMGEESTFSWFSIGSIGSVNKNYGVIPYDYISMNNGILKYSLGEQEERNLKETSEFHKLLEEDEIIQVGANEYKIAKVKHGDDGKMYYYVDVEYEDEESKKEALKQIELRDAYLKGRKLIEKENADKEKIIVVPDNPPNRVMKWLKLSKRKSMK